MMSSRTEWNIMKSTMSKNTRNPGEFIAEKMKKIESNPDKEMILMALGDPTVFGNLPLCKEFTDAVERSLHSEKYNGYQDPVGSYSARQAVADYSSQYGTFVKAEDIVLTNGCSQALKWCIEVLANPGDNFLVPLPGYGVYGAICLGQGIQVRHYKLLPEKQWEADLEHMDSLIDDRTAAIIVTNPSNPCGSVYSKEHLIDILTVAEKHKIPIIADEIYEDMVFSGQKFHSIASVSTTVPILSCSGLTKKFLVPGWRFGWIIIHDRNNAFKEVKEGFVSMSQVILGPNSIIEGALPDILAKVKPEFFQKTIQLLEGNAKHIYESLSKIPGLIPIMPQGALYFMFGFDSQMFVDIKDDLDFTEKLLAEQSVFCIPGQCFCYPNFVRLVLYPPAEQVQTAMSRIAEFCEKHKRHVA